MVKREREGGVGVRFDRATTSVAHHNTILPRLLHSQPFKSPSAPLLFSQLDVPFFREHQA